MKASRLTRFFLASAALTLPLIGGLAWYVLSEPPSRGTSADSDSASRAGEASTPRGTSPLSTERPAVGKAGSIPEPKRSLTTRPASGDEALPVDLQAQPGSASPAHPWPVRQTDEHIFALSEHLAYGPRKSDPSRVHNAVAGTGFLPAVFLDATPPIVPLALLDPVPEASANAEQIGALNQLRESFAKTLGGPKADHDSAEYRENWDNAQPGADEQYRLWFGDQAYMAQQLAQHMAQEKQGK